MEAEEQALSPTAKAKFIPMNPEESHRQDDSLCCLAVSRSLVLKYNLKQNKI